MKNTKQTLSQQAIMIYSRKIREVKSQVIEEYTKNIEKELSVLHPELAKYDDGIENWASDLSNTESDDETISTLTRLEEVLSEREAKRMNDGDEELCVGNSCNNLGDRVSSLEDRIAYMEAQLTEVRDTVREIRNHI